MGLMAARRLFLTVLYLGVMGCRVWAVRGDGDPVELKSSRLTRTGEGGGELGPLAVSQHHGPSRRRRAVTSSEMQILLNLHNRFRRQEGSSDMEHMRWNTRLAEMAELWSSSCVWGHGQPVVTDPPFRGVIGQNLYASVTTDLSLSVEVAMHAWYTDEKPNYVYNTGDCLKGKCGHYTQIVWAETREVGCAYSLCPTLTNSPIRQNNFNYLVCNYGPAGNFGGLKPYKKGQSCSQCASGSFWCDAGLCRSDCLSASSSCQCRALCQNNGCQTDQCQCQCQPGWTGLDCSRPCEDRHEFCGVGNGWPPSWCNHDTAGSYVRIQCQHMCGFCKKAGESAPVQCLAASPTPPPPAPVPTGSGVMGADCSAQVTCLNQGLARTTQIGCICFCPAGWRGSRCQEINVPTQAPTPSPTQAPTPLPPTAQPDCSRTPCQNGGVGRALATGCACQCQFGWQGVYCQESTSPTPSPTQAPTPRPPTPQPDCSRRPCQNGGVGLPLGTGCACRCPWGWQGIYCQENSFPTQAPTVSQTSPRPRGDCSRLPCQNGGVGRAVSNGCRCLCQWGWQGVYCEESSFPTQAPTPAPTPQREDCSLLPCQNGGQGLVLSTGCECACQWGWQGFYCEEPVIPTTPPPPLTPFPTTRGQQTSPRPDCSLLRCLNGGFGSPGPAGCACACPASWQGSLCQEPAIPAPSRPTTIGRRPALPVTRPSPSLPSIPRSSRGPSADCSLLACLNGGLGRRVPSGCVCFCPDPWQGDRCQERRTGPKPSFPVPSPAVPGVSVRVPARGPFTRTPGECLEVQCENGGEGRREGTSCVCFCRGDSQGSTCQESRTQARDGLIILTSTRSIFWNDMTAAITSIFERHLASFCQTNPRKCCGAASDPSDRFDFSGGVKIGDSYPRATLLFGQQLSVALVYVEPRTNNRQCQKSLPQDVLLEALFPAQPDLEAALQSCCAADLLDIRKGVVKDNRRLDDVTSPLPVTRSGSGPTEEAAVSDGAFRWMGLPMWLIIAIPIGVFVFLVLIVIIIVLCCRRQSQKSDPPPSYNSTRSSRSGKLQKSKPAVVAPTLERIELQQKGDADLF